MFKVQSNGEQKKDYRTNSKMLHKLQKMLDKLQKMLDKLQKMLDKLQKLETLIFKI